jgi:hypothetical protein
MAETFVSPGVYVRERDFSFYVSTVGGSSLALVGETKKGPAFKPTLVRDMGEFREKFGGLDPNKLVGYAAKSYFKYANSAYIVRVLGSSNLREGGYIIPIVETGGTVIATFLVSATTTFSISGDTSGDCYLTIDDHYTGSVNFVDSTSSVYAPRLFPRSDYIGSATLPADGYGVATQSFFPTEAAVGYTISGVSGVNYTGTSTAMASATDPYVVEGYSNASTPVIVGNIETTTDPAPSLFQIFTQSDGVEANKEIKIAIENIDPSTGKFDVVVREYDDTNARPVILEKFSSVVMDKTSDNYIARRIGDSRDEDLATYPLVSKYIYVEVAANGQNQLAGKYPMGFNRIPAPFSGDVLFTNGYTGILSGGSFPEFPMTLDYVDTTLLTKQWLGVDYSNIDEDLLMQNVSSVWDLTESSTSYIKGFHINTGASTTYYQTGLTSSSSVAYSALTKSSRKFIVPVLGGSDGWPYWDTAREYLSDSDPIASDGVDYSIWTEAIDLLSNPEEYDINLLALPGVPIDSGVGTYAREMVETRADCLYVGDMPSTHESATAAAAVGDTIDSNYACTYWPYVKIYDADNGEDVMIPPTPQALEAMAYTDSVSYPWFAPAGLNRGLLTDVIRAQYKLTQDERDELYESKINPIASFPGQGIAIWGQKTLQTRTTALDRINVRRMLLYVEKVIAGASKYLVFEQNDSTTWDRFKSLVQPVLDVVKVKRGLVDFRVIMDETTNTPEIIDRNQMVGQIYIKPTKTAEAILINFNILPQGAVFEE